MKGYNIEIGPKPNDVKVWGFGVGMLPLFPGKRTKEAVKYIANLEGFIGVHPTPRGTVCIFRTENDAKRGMNLTKAKGIQTGGNVVELYVDKSFVDRVTE